MRLIRFTSTASRVDRWGSPVWHELRADFERNGVRATRCGRLVLPDREIELGYPTGDERLCRVCENLWAHNEVMTTTVFPSKLKKMDVAGEGFLQSQEWQRLRYDVLAMYQRRCMNCGVSGDYATLQVDHVLPRHSHPELALDWNNLQVLCRDCNMGKGRRDETDFRLKEQPWMN